MTTTTTPSGGHAVIATRREPPDSLDYFPTPPWATRALLVHVIPTAKGTAWEPAAGGGHMAAVLEERFDQVFRSDVHDYGGNYVGSFVGEGLDVIQSPRNPPDWVITNPPFNLAEAFFERAIREARRGVALLVRTQWLEGLGRYERVFMRHPPDLVAPFVERVPMHKGRWEPDGDTMTAYMWIVWRADVIGRSRIQWIPPGCRQRLEHPDDRRKFGAFVPDDEKGLDLFQTNHP